MNRRQIHNFHWKFFRSDETRCTNFGICSIGITNIIGCKKTLIRFGFNVCCRIKGLTVLGPHILDGSLIGACYLGFVHNAFKDIFDALNSESPAMFRWTQQDQELPHKTRKARNYLGLGRFFQLLGCKKWTSSMATSISRSVLDIFPWETKKLYFGSYERMKDIRNR